MKKNKFNVKFVWVRDNEDEYWQPAMFLNDLGEQINLRYRVIANYHENRYLSGLNDVVSTGYHYIKPFTPEDFFKHCLPDWLAEKAVANIGNNNNKQFSNCIETLKGCFEWEKTHEGLDFWCDVLNHMENPEECGLPYNPITEEEVPEESPFNQFKCKCVDISSLDKIVNYCFLCGRKLK